MLLLSEGMVVFSTSWMYVSRYYRSEKEETTVDDRKYRVSDLVESFSVG